MRPIRPPNVLPTASKLDLRAVRFLPCLGRMLRVFNMQGRLLENTVRCGGLVADVVWEGLDLILGG